MKKKTATLVLGVILVLSLCGCREKETENLDKAAISENDAVQEEQASEIQEENLEAAFSFENFENLQFCFSSGVGGWATLLTINADGSFEGEFFDGDLGSAGDGYPNGTMYQSIFSGQFTEPVKVNEYTYSMQIQEINYEKFGTEEIKDGMLYCYGDAYGLEGAGDFLIYLPGAPLSELPEEFRSWVGYYDLSGTTDTTLPFYALNNEARQYGFSSYDIIDRIQENIASAESWATSLEDSLENDALNQMQLNDTSEQLYNVWDSTLNQLWDVLKKTQDTETMNVLLVEEREWIAAKEQAAEEAGAEFEGGSMQPMVMNLKAAEMTKVRVYELLELLK